MFNPLMDVKKNDKSNLVHGTVRALYMKLCSEFTTQLHVQARTTDVQCGIPACPIIS